MAFAHNTKNMYILSKDQYNILLSNSVTFTYKRTNNNIKKKMNFSRRNILKVKEALQRMDINGWILCSKTTKGNFQLINLAKNELRKLSKFIIEATNKELTIN